MSPLKIDRSLRDADLNTVRELALRSGSGPQSLAANEWYWVGRVGHPLVDHVRTREFFSDRWWYCKELTRDEIEGLTSADLHVLSLSLSIEARVIAAKHERTPAIALTHLATDSEAAVRNAVGHNGATPGKVIEKMHSEFRRMNPRASSNPEVSSSRLEWLWLELDQAGTFLDTKAIDDVIFGRSPFDDGRLRLARKSGLPRELRIRLAGFYGLESEAAGVLARDEYLDVRAEIAGNMDEKWDGSVAEILSRDNAAEVRAALAGSSRTPVHLLERLAADPDPDVRIAAGSNSKLPHELLAQMLSDGDTEVREQVIVHGDFTYDELAALEDREEYRDHLIARLGYSSWTAKWGREHLYGNGSYTWEQASGVTSSEADASTEFLRRLTRSPHPSVRLAVALNTGTPEDALEILAGDTEPDIRDAVHRVLGTDNTRNYGYYSDPLIWWYRREWLDAEKLSRAKSATVRALMAPRVSGEALHALALDSDPMVREAAARNPRLQFGDLVALCDDPEVSVRDAATSEIISALKAKESARESSEPRTFWITEAIDLPEPLAELVKSSTEFRIIDHRARNFHYAHVPGSWAGWTSRPHLRALAVAANPAVRAAVASFAGSPRGDNYWSGWEPLDTESLSKLLSDPEEQVREAALTSTSSGALTIAGEPNSNSAVLVGFARSTSTEVRGAVAGNPSTPSAALANLVRDREAVVRRSVAENPNTPIEALQALTADEDDSVVEALLGNPHTPAPFLEMQVAQLDASYSAVRKARRIAGNVNAPSAVLRSLAYSRDEEVRALVAGNPVTDSETLQILMLDESRRVRGAVAARGD